MAIIGKIRKRASLAVLFVAVAILAFVFNDLFSKQKTAPMDILKVDGSGVNVNEYMNDVDIAENNTKKQNQTASLTQEQSFAIKTQIFESSLQRLLLEEQYGKLGLMVTQTEMTDMILGDFIHPEASRQFTDPKTGQYNKQAISQYLSNFAQLQPEEQQSWKQFEEYIHDSRLRDKYEQLLSAGFYMPKAAAQYAATVYDHITDARYVKIPLTSIPDDQVKLTDQDYEKYYKEHKNLFKIDEEMRDIEFVKFAVYPSQSDLSALSDSMQRAFVALQESELKEVPSLVNNVSDTPFDSTFVRPNQLNNFFPDSLTKGLSAGSLIAPRQMNQRWVAARILKTDQRPDSIRISQILILNNTVGHEKITRTKEEAKQYADSVYQILNANPSTYESSIVAYSDDPEAANNFGDSKWLLDMQVPATLFEQIRNRKAGDIFLYELPSGVGYSIVKVTGKTDPVFKVQAAVISIDIHASDKTINEIRDKAHRFIGGVKTVEQMKASAEEQNQNLLSASIRATDYNMQGLSFAREIVRWAYNENTEVGIVSGDVYELSDAFVIAGLKEIKKKGILPLSQIKTLIETEVRSSKKAEMLYEKAIADTKGLTSLESIAAKLSLTIDSASKNHFGDGYFHKEGPEMRLIGTLSATTKPQLLAPVKGYNGAYIVQVDRVYKSEPKTDPMSIMQRFNNTIMQRVSQLNFPIRILRENAKIESNFNFYQ